MNVERVAANVGAEDAGVRPAARRVLPRVPEENRVVPAARNDHVLVQRVILEAENAVAVARSRGVEAAGRTEAREHRASGVVVQVDALVLAAGRVLFAVRPAVEAVGLIRRLRSAQSLAGRHVPVLDRAVGVSRDEHILGLVAGSTAPPQGRDRVGVNGCGRKGRGAANGRPPKPASDECVENSAAARVENADAAIAEARCEHRPVRRESGDQAFAGQMRTLRDRDALVKTARRHLKRAEHAARA